MSNLYNASDVTGHEYTRAYQVLIDHPIGKPPRATFFEERVLQTQGPPRTHAVGSLDVPYDPDAQIEVRNPMTGDLTGQSVSMGELHALLFSAYFHFATVRDAAGGEEE